MTLLALDLGEKRVGLAISKSNIIAEPLLTLAVDDDFLPQLKKICREQEIEKLIIGIPKSYGSVPTLQEEKIKKWAQEIASALAKPLVLIDESYSTKIAQLRNPNQPVDEESACVILESYLEQRKKG